MEHGSFRDGTFSSSEHLPLGHFSPAAENYHASRICAASVGVLAFGFGVRVR